MYTSAIVIDFGSSNSGAARIDTYKNGRLVYSTPQFCHSDGYYAKDATWFFIHPKLLERAEINYESLHDDDFRILSRVFMNTLEPNIIWGRDLISANCQKIKQENWVEFKYFKMMIYLDVSYPAKLKSYPISLIVKIFLRILKIECISVESAFKGRTISSSEIQWGVTIPSIWTEDNQRLMSDICQNVFGDHVRVLSEPEGPVVSERIHASNNAQLDHSPGKKSIVVDMGGGTTDICLLADKEVISESDSHFQLLASCDGIGVGGNMIDKDFWIYFLRFISKGITNGIIYDKLSDDELKNILLQPYIDDLVHAIDMEKAWLAFKHKVDKSFKIPSDYRKWLINNGHSSVADRVTDILIGQTSFDMTELYEQAFAPTFNKISQCVESFLKTHNHLIKDDVENLSLIFAGGLSLNQKLRDLIMCKINEMFSINVSTNIANIPLRASGSIMDGASYLLLWRRFIQREAPFYIYDCAASNLMALQEAYKEKGVLMKYGELNAISQKDIEERKASNDRVCGFPVAIKGADLLDYRCSFCAVREEQKSIELSFYGSYEIIVHPQDNILAWELGSTLLPNYRNKSYVCIVDFNETNTGNLHYYVTLEESNELIKEGNISLTNKSKK